MDWVSLIYRPLTVHAARRVLVGRVRSRLAPERGRFVRADVDGLLKRAWADYLRRTADLPPQPTAGSRMNLRLACFTLSFFDALTASGAERDHAIDIVADAAWSIYRLWARIALGLARLTFRKTTALGFAVVGDGGRQGQVSLRFPFNAPGYLVETVPAAGGTAFDVVRCPVAAYFREQGAADLCVASWCNLDYALAQLTHEKLVRTKTLAEGQGRCDFRLSRS